MGIVNVDVWIYGADVERGRYRPQDRFHRLFVSADGKALVGVCGSSKGNRINSFALIQCEGDGPSGETIVSVLMPPMPSEDADFKWHIPKWFGVVTNRGTQGIFGQQASIEEACSIEPPSGFDIVDLFLSPAFMNC